MITWTFKNKLRSLDDIEFLNYLRNKDNYPQKLIGLIEQEARKRYFSNREFNGQDDEYIHPAVQNLNAERKRRLLRKTSTLVAFVVIAFATVYLMQANFLQNISFSNISEQIGQLINNPVQTPPVDDGIIVLTEPDEENDDQKANESENLDQNGDLQSSNLQISETQPEKVTHQALADYVPSHIVSAPRAVDSRIEPDTEKPKEKIVEPEIQEFAPETTSIKTPVKTDLKEEQKVPEKIEKIVGQTTLPAIEAPKISTETDETAVVAKIPAANEKKPLKEPHINESEADITNAQMLSNKLLRRYIPFLYDWAQRQTLQAEITDYFIENNSIVSFKISKAHSDFIEDFKETKLQSLMNNYWNSLDNELGKDFPRTTIVIRFLRFDDDL